MGSGKTHNTSADTVQTKTGRIRKNPIHTKYPKKHHKLPNRVAYGLFYIAGSWRRRLSRYQMQNLASRLFQKRVSTADGLFGLATKTDFETASMQKMRLWFRPEA
ncbi:MAG: hypothetical protein KAR11_07485 [Phycisphaerae bacterium]|nr:hypothetical protein [Phycisphaerae bacterium]